MVSQEVPQIIIDLVENFKENEHLYKSASYDEENTKVEFINPFFEALGWDVNNKSRASPRFKEVVFEDTIKIGGKAKAPDYSFRIGGQRIFFVEAKKPSVNIDTDKNPAYQIRRYGWSAKLPLCILTDFEELAVYETTTRPDKNQTASIGRIKYYKYTEYIDKWEEIYNIFSKEAVLSGKFDNYANNTKGIKKGTSEVDKEFLKEIDRWRELLARNIALRNPEVTIGELNHAVQLTIDRIIFLRMAEDRGIEKYQQLKNLLELSSKNKDEYAVYEGFLEICKKADAKYNSGLFHFTEEKEISLDADNLTPNLKIDDKVFKDILAPMYYPDCPYEFSVISPEILGNVYERFLGKEIRLTKSHQAKIEYKPEVQKAGGVFYTPEYIVKYIVEKTVGDLIKDKTPKQVSKLRFLDPACGSGSFLLEIYQYLLDWHLDYYSNLERIPKDVIFTGKDGITRLTINEKKRIVLNNIYGVDIDTQAVEVTKLSLLLKVLEDQNKDVVEQQQKLFQERALPYLGDNIKCGNSLIGTDILEQEDLTMQEISKLNPFDWEDEFKEVFDDGGFDVVVGNPPYIKIQVMKENSPMSLEYYNKNYVSAKKGNYDSYIIFVEKAVSLMNQKGKFGFIIPHKFFNAQYGKPLRLYLKDNKLLDKIVHFGDIQVFENATTYSCLLFLNYSNSNSFDFYKVNDLKLLNSNKYWQTYSYDDLNDDSWTFLEKDVINILKKLKKNNHDKLGSVAKIFVGTQTSADNIFILNCIDQNEDYSTFLNQNNEEIILESAIFKPFLKNIKDKSFEPYMFVNSNYKLLFPYKIENNKAIPFTLKEIKRFPKAYEYLLSNKKDLLKRSNIKSNMWWIYPYPKNLAIMEDPKLIIPVLSLYPRLIYDETGYYMTGGGGGPFYGLRPYDNELSIFYLMGVLNSNIFNFYVSNKSTQMRGGYFRYSKQYIEDFPIPLNFDSNIVNYVQKVIYLNKQLFKCNTPKEKRLIEKQIEITKKKINELVYEIYDLTDGEIEIIEKSIE